MPPAVSDGLRRPIPAAVQGEWSFILLARLSACAERVVNCDALVGGTAQYTVRTAPVRPVGSFARDRSPFRLYDTAGNAAEWCIDEHDATYYAWSPDGNHSDLETRGLKVL